MCWDSFLVNNNFGYIFFGLLGDNITDTLYSTEGLLKDLDMGSIGIPGIVAFELKGFQTEFVVIVVDRGVSIRLENQESAEWNILPLTAGELTRVNGRLLDKGVLFKEDSDYVCHIEGFLWKLTQNYEVSRMRDETIQISQMVDV